MNIEHKGSEGVPDVTPEEYTITVGLDFMRRLCLRECFLQTDGEPAADDFAKRLKAAREEKTHLRGTPRHSSASQGSPSNPGGGARFLMDFAAKFHKLRSIWSPFRSRMIFLYGA